MEELVVERRAPLGNEISDLNLHPVLRRAYAARGGGDALMRLVHVQRSIVDGAMRGR